MRTAVRGSKDSMMAREKTTMECSTQLLLFSLDDRRLALRLSSVERVIRAVALTPLPGAPRIVLGVINVTGNIIPVVDMRSRFGLSFRMPDIDDQYIVVHTDTRTLAVVVDAVDRLVEVHEQEIVGSNAVLADLDYVQGLLKVEGGIILIHDLDRFLSLDEEKILDTALAQGESVGYER